ncbi:DHH family phosphoesterase [Halovenus marina]|uniref:DHH family phosphoesterase n=1 Tax=Halovenus marina TaxID=3396621 RepID=UPI003F5580CA
MDDRLIDDDRLSLERKSVLPGEGFFQPDSLADEQAEREAQERLDGAEVVVVADPDADGLAATALIQIARGTATLLPAGPHEIDRALSWVAEHTDGADVYICDLCPDHADDLADLDSVVETAAAVTWYDHHQWDEELADRVRAADVTLVVGPSDEVCTADVTLEALEYDFPEQYVELAAATRDHDLWIREDERSDDLADFAYWVDPGEYIQTIVDHGPNLPETAQDLLAERRVEKEALIEKAVARASLREVGPWTVGVTYGRCSQNEVAEQLREQGADAAVIVKPAGSASIRGTDSFERCHEVAAQVNGGGHPKAAGCKPDIYEDMLDYAHHWSTQGAVAKQAILDAFKRLEDSHDEG